MNPADAKQFIIARLIAEAEVEQVNLSEVEKKMLQFTEAERATQDMAEAVAEFERSCDCDEYQSKVISLLKVRALATWCNHTNENTRGAIPYRQSSKKITRFWSSSIVRFPNSARQYCPPIGCVIT